MLPAVPSSEAGDYRVVNAQVFAGYRTGETASIPELAAGSMRRTLIG